mgnify:CR=1 FL=1
MKLIKVTSINTNEPIYINVDQIGHIRHQPATSKHSLNTPAHTVIGVTTHNNGGFNVKESVEEIINLINN